MVVVVVAEAAMVERVKGEGGWPAGFCKRTPPRISSRSMLSLLPSRLVLSNKARDEEEARRRDKPDN